MSTAETVIGVPAWQNSNRGMGVTGGWGERGVGATGAWAWQRPWRNRGMDGRR